MAAGKPGVEGRKELEADPSTNNAAPVNSGGMSTGSHEIHCLFAYESPVFLCLLPTGRACA